MLHNFAVNICAKVSLTLLFTCVRQCVDLADRLTDVLATAISYVTLVLLRKYPIYVHQVLGEHEFILHEFH